MKVVLTLLCRNEADIVASTVEFHLSRGVDFIIATDNGSTDGTTEILDGYQRQGVLRLLHEPSHTHDQAVWVSRMARIAAEEYAADWVIPCDADEFWWPRAGSFQAELARVPAEQMAIQVERFNFLPPAEDIETHLPFHQRQILRERRSLNSVGDPLLPKVCHRAHPGITVSDGNHDIYLNGQLQLCRRHEGLQILHFPVRSYRQFELKIRQGAQALASNPRLAPQIGITWRRLYSEHLLSGTLPDYYAALRPQPEALAASLASGELVEDRRLQQALVASASVPQVPQPAMGAGPAEAQRLAPRRWTTRLTRLPQRLFRRRWPARTSPLPRIAVITPYYSEDLGLLRQCHRSVLDQTMPCLHVLVADGRPRRRLSLWDAHHVVLPASHCDIGSTPRLIGAYHAIGLGVEAVAFLDADNWYAPDHIASLMSAREREGAAFVSSSRLLCRLDGSPMGPCPLTDPDRFIDTNCMLFGREAFPLLHHWVLMPDYGHLIGDRILLQHVHASGLPRCHVSAASVYYRCGKEGLYQQLGEPLPPGVSPRPDYESALDRWVADGHPPLL